MSIVVTCECAQTYRLPNRYAGKRCKCRECGERIRVPAEAEEAPKRPKAKKRKRKRKRSKAKARVDQISRDTTRRLGAEAGDIITEGKQLREAISRRRPISESIHQLSPLHSQNVLDDGVAAPSRRLKSKKPKRRRSTVEERPAREKSKTRSKTKRPETRPGKTSSTKAKKAKDKAKRKTKAKAKATTARGKVSKGKTTTKLGKGKTTAKVSKGKTAKLGSKGKVAKGKGKAGKVTAKIGRRGEREDRTKRRPARSSAAARRGRRDSGRDADVETPRKRRSPTKHALMAVIAIVGVLCLGIGLIVGGVFNDQGVAKSDDVDTKLEYLEQLTFQQQWAAAVTEADKLETSLAGNQSALARLFKMRRGIDAMSQIDTIQDPEAKLRNLLNYVRDKAPAVRLAVSLGLRKMAESDEAQRALLALTKDEDKRVAEASRMGMVHVGGRHSIPFLLEVIEQTASTGGKAGDLAVDQALQIQDAAVAPVLVKVLELRKGASPAMLRQVLNRLSEIATDPKHAAAAKPFTTHKDKGVQEAAKAVIAALG